MTIRRCIYLAQVYSDAAKGIYELYMAEDIKYLSKSYCYYMKDKYIINTINKINITNSSEYNYFVTTGFTDDNHKSFIVYFSTPVGQCSFHCFDNRLLKFINKGRKTHWDHKDSRETCKNLY